MAEMKFNPPPNWPPPEPGFTPAPGWEPDPAWGPAPHGWPLWVEATAPKKPGHLGRNMIIGGAALLVVSIVLAVVLGGNGSKKPAAATPGTVSHSATPTASDSTTTDDSAAAAHVPTAGDFTIKIKVTKKDCFGSAGCNVEFHIIPSYSGLPFSGTYQVTYKVSGDSDGPQVDSFTIDDDGTATYDSDEIASTSSSHTILKAKVTDIEAQ